jgi:glycerophosphoryl diester phosphodiesterase
VTRIIAHRGASAGAGGVDNSLDAFERAIALGADGIEFDVRRTRDDALVAFHDATVRGRPVGRLTRAEIGAAVGQEPPLLDDVLALTAGRIGLDVELKEAGYVDRVLAALAASFAGELVVTSFLDPVVAEVKRRSPGTRAGLLIGVGRPSELTPVGRATRCDADLIAMHHLAARGALGRVADAGFPVFVWTVNPAAQLRRWIADDRVEAVITDMPERALAIRDEVAAA